MKKINLMKRKRCFRIAISAILLLVILGIPILLLRFLDYELVNNIFSVYASIGTFLAVITALFKEKILAWINHPELICELQNDSSSNCGFVEIIDTDVSSSMQKASSYQVLLLVQNKGSAIAQGCEILLTSIGYKNIDSANSYSYVNGFTPRKIRHEGVEYMHPGGEDCFQLIELKSPDSSKTPNDNTSREASISILGYDDISYSKKLSRAKTLELKYRIQCRNEVNRDVVITVKWTGIWQHRRTEMEKELTITLDK